MQSAEAHALGQTQKGGAAAVMQCAADANERSGKLNLDEDQAAGGYLDMAVTKTAVTGQLLETQYVGGQAVRSTLKFMPTNHEIAASEAVTIGQALQAVVLKAGEKPVEGRDARAIQSAVKRATGKPALEKGSMAATAQAAAELNPRLDEVAQTTLSDILVNAPEKLPRDKVLTREDAEKVLEAEARANRYGFPTPGGVAEALMAGARLNEQIGAITLSETTLYPAENISAQVSRLDLPAEDVPPPETSAVCADIAPLPEGAEIGHVIRDVVINFESSSHSEK
uniref:Late embryogenesis abundant protein LEA7-3 n=1 Tax=Pinus tabuliformis TaxID=88731 RepID=A0A0A7RED5_PINTB|nr:late embryogenesis abundant protein LEA7-3 [Pinus tabuliformis]